MIKFSTSSHKTLMPISMCTGTLFFSYYSFFLVNLGDKNPWLGSGKPYLMFRQVSLSHLARVQHVIFGSLTLLPVNLAFTQVSLPHLARAQCVIFGRLTLLPVNLAFT